jgi:hypothetical protein
MEQIMEWLLAKMESKLENIEAKLKTQIGFFTSKTNANEKK